MTVFIITLTGTRCADHRHSIEKTPSQLSLVFDLEDLYF